MLEYNSLQSWRQHFERACAAIELKRWEIAHEQIVHAISISPNNSLLHAVRAEVCYRQGNYGESRSAAREAIAQDPSSKLGYYWLGWSLITDFLAGPVRITEALNAADRALECDPNDADSHYLRSTVARVAGNTYEARTFAASGLQINPEHIGCLEALARIQAGLHSDRDAEVTLRQILRLEPESTYANEEMARVRLRGGQFDDAYEHASTAIRQEPNSADARDLHAEVVRHQHPVARFLLWSAKPWDQYLTLIILLALTPLLSLGFLPSNVSEQQEALLTVLAILFLLGCSAYGALAVIAAETIIAHSARLSALVPEIREYRTIYAFVWVSAISVVAAVIIGALRLSWHPLLLVGNLVTCGIVFLIARRAIGKLQRSAACAVTIIPATIQVIAFCWPLKESERPQPFLVFACWVLAILLAFIFTADTK